ncbi:L-threonylcarbamoyladenylate synthase [Crocinitomicaceae bacterium]|nr:L-threonylcarbamoyladenylate synthase [Crocinitomicaceae bacterium]MDB3906081.1 L-threonylcarbamoyladenylate synthase [Crocinitomicaceae bacterium]
MISTDVYKAADLLRNGEVVGIPTETVYGLAASIYSEKAVRKIFEIKQRPLDNPLIVHVASIDQMETLTKDVPEKAYKLAWAFWPGPMTLLLPKSIDVPKLITAGKPNVAIRMPGLGLTRELIANSGVPIAAPSANPFGRISPTTAEHVANYFPDAISMVLDGGPCRSGIESTIIGFDGEDPVVYRLGSLALDEIEAKVGKVQLRNQKDVAPDAPGMLSRHYSPKTPTVLCDDIASEIGNRSEEKIGVIVLQHKIESESLTQKVLSPQGDLKEAAKELYATMHELDQAGLDLILIERMPETGLGVSINDRLQRAAQGK